MPLGKRAAQTATLRFRTVLMGSLRSSFVRWKYVAKYQKMERTEQSERLALVKEKEKAENELAEARKANQETVAAMRSKQAENAANHRGCETIHREASPGEARLDD